MRSINILSATASASDFLDTLLSRIKICLEDGGLTLKRYSLKTTALYVTGQSADGSTWTQPLVQWIIRATYVFQRTDHLPAINQTRDMGLPGRCPRSIPMGSVQLGG
ncbi:hypothetical protein QNM99_05815 [Pseudomonas sp. PCH446]